MDGPTLKFSSMFLNTNIPIRHAKKYTRNVYMLFEPDKTVESIINPETANRPVNRFDNKAMSIAKQTKIHPPLSMNGNKTASNNDKI